MVRDEMIVVGDEMIVVGDEMIVVGDKMIVVSRRVGRGVLGCDRTPPPPPPHGPKRSAWKLLVRLKK